jgi:hypothetical protein
MSARVPDHEYAAIRSSWRNAQPEREWTLGRMADACWLNLQAAAKLEAERRALYASLPAGDPRIVGDPARSIEPLGYLIQVAVSDQRHWKGELAYWRNRSAQEGRDTKVSLGWLGSFNRPVERKPVRPAPILAPDPRLPREPGDDDGDELPF